MGVPPRPAWKAQWGEGGHIEEGDAASSLQDSLQSQHRISQEETCPNCVPPSVSRASARLTPRIQRLFTVAISIRSFLFVSPRSLLLLVQRGLPCIPFCVSISLKAHIDRSTSPKYWLLGWEGPQFKEALGLWGQAVQRS